MALLLRPPPLPAPSRCPRPASRTPRTLTRSRRAAHPTLCQRAGISPRVVQTPTQHTRRAQDRVAPATPTVSVRWTAASARSVVCKAARSFPPSARVSPTPPASPSLRSASSTPANSGVSARQDARIVWIFNSAPMRPHSRPAPGPITTRSIFPPQRRVAQSARSMATPPRIALSSVTPSAG